MELDCLDDLKTKKDRLVLYLVQPQRYSDRGFVFGAFDRQSFLEYLVVVIAESEVEIHEG